jgi:hypothetical protein
MIALAFRLMREGWITGTASVTKNAPSAAVMPVIFSLSFSLGLEAELINSALLLKHIFSSWMILPPGYLQDIKDLSINNVENGVYYINSAKMRY